MGEVLGERFLDHQCGIAAAPGGPPWRATTPLGPEHSEAAPLFDQF
jgi:hypothetical protein